MKTPTDLIYRVLLFSVPLAIASAYMEVRLNEVTNSYNSHRADFEKGVSEIEILVLGNSEAAFGIDPDQFGGVGFNLANVGQDYYYDVSLALRYVDQMPKLSTVVLTFSYFGLWYKLADQPDGGWRTSLYYQFWDIEPETVSFDLRNVSKIAMYSPSVSMDYLLKGFNVDVSRNVHNGWQPQSEGPVEQTVSADMAERRVSVHAGLIRQINLASNLSTIDKLLGELQRRKMRVVLISVPVSVEYSDFADPDILAANRSIINEMSSRHGVSYHDYSQDSRFGHEHFVDANHLNEAGAQKFSRLLDAEVLMPRSAYDEE